MGISQGRLRGLAEHEIGCSVPQGPRRNAKKEPYHSERGPSVWAVLDLAAVVLSALPPSDQLTLRLASTEMCVVVNRIAVEATVDALLPLLLAEPCGRLGAQGQTHRLRMLPRVNALVKMEVIASMQDIADELINEDAHYTGTEGATSTEGIVVDGVDIGGGPSCEEEGEAGGNFKIRAFGSAKDGTFDVLSTHRIFKDQFQYLLEAISRDIRVESLVDQRSETDDGPEAWTFFGKKKKDAETKKQLFVESNTKATSSNYACWGPISQRDTELWSAQTYLKVAKLYRDPAKWQGDKVPDSFLASNSSLQVADFPGLCSSTPPMMICSDSAEKEEGTGRSPSSFVTEVGNSFLANARSLELVDLYPLKNVTVLGDNFLERAESLLALDASPLRNLRRISHGFLTGCHSLAVVNLDHLGHVQSIGDNFLSCCASLSWVSIRGLANLQVVGDDWLASSPRVQHVALGGLTKLKAVGSKFLYKSQQVKTLDLSGMDQLAMRRSLSEHTKEVSDLIGKNFENGFNNACPGGDFLSDCYSLEELTLPDHFPNVTAIHNHFLATASSLKSLSLRPFRSVKSIGTEFLAGASFLRVLDTTSLSPNLTHIGQNFLKGCRTLESLNLAGLGGVTEIPEGFLSYCASLKAVDLSPLANVRTIRRGFMSQCNKLQSIDSLREMVSVDTLSLLEFLSGCRDLREVDLSKWRRLGAVQGGAVTQRSERVTGKDNTDDDDNGLRSFDARWSAKSTGPSTGPNWRLPAGQRCVSVSSSQQGRTSSLASSIGGKSSRGDSAPGTGLIGCRNLRQVLLPMHCNPEVAGDGKVFTIDENDFNLPPGCKVIYA